MDPYLEDPLHWRDVHHSLISEISATLTAQLRPVYVARIEERTYVSHEPGLVDNRIREAYVTLLHLEQRKVVTIIEVLSPTNKTPHSEGRESHQRKRIQVMRSRTHLVEIDLLREGDRVDFESEAPRCEYLMHVSRIDERPEGEVWPVRLNERLPELRIPLRPEDEDARLDLQAVLNSVYDRAGYDLIAEYSREPIPPLAPEWREWARQLLVQGRMQQ
jgi:hypothetical protein